MVKYKSEFEMYLLMVNSAERVSLTKFRCSNHKLPCSFERLTFGEDHETVCNKCDSGHRGDEFHYLFACKSFSANRKLYLDKYYYENPNAYKVNKLFNNKSTHILSKLGKFVKIIMENF
jgi:hypothetical protein